MSRCAAVYVRQSDPYQRLHNTGSTAVQRALSEQAQVLGWSIERVRIYEDGGKSATFRAERPQFDRLLEAILKREIGMVLVVDPSRTARNLEEWGKLVELLRLTDTLMFSEDNVFDVTNSEDEARLNESFLDLHEAYRESMQRMRESTEAQARVGKLKNAL